MEKLLGVFFSDTTNSSKRFTMKNGVIKSNTKCDSFTWKKLTNVFIVNKTAPQVQLIFCEDKLSSNFKTRTDA